MEKKGVVLYIGGFELPDKNAAAQRVVGNAYALKTLGYEVVFLNKTACKSKTETSCFGFKCINSPKTVWKYVLFAKEVKKVIRQYNVTHVIAYNYPAIALRKVIRYCKRHSVRCYADVTEWYEIKGNPLKKVLKGYDVSLRMKKLHMNMDGVIAISEYLYRYYSPNVKTVKIPPLVNIYDEKWGRLDKNDDTATVISYVGSPSARKERLDLIVNAVEKICLDKKVLLIIVGVSQEEFERIYSVSPSSPAVVFKGRLSHNEAVQIVKKSDWTIVVRENASFVEAGFPTKVVESISCGTPVLANKFSNIQDYLNEHNSILFDTPENMAESIRVACDKKLLVDNSTFHYSRFLDSFEELLNND